MCDARESRRHRHTGIFLTTALVVVAPVVGSLVGAGPASAAGRVGRSPGRIRPFAVAQRRTAWAAASATTRASALPGREAASERRPHRAPRRQAAAVVLAADASVSPGVDASLVPGVADDCSTDVSEALSTWLNSLPPGSTWTPPSGACYLVDGGVHVSFPAALTIDGGTFEELNNKSPAPTGPGTQRGHPAFKILGGTDVTLENMRIVGAHHGSSYRAALAFEAGIELDGTTHATITDVAIDHTFGDGINLEPLRGGDDYRSGRIVEPVEDLTVSGVTIRDAGRQGVTAASVDGATFSDVKITGVAFNAWDFESDQRNEGAKNVVIDGCTFSGLNISMAGPATGPITMDDCVMPKTDHGDAVRIENMSGRPLDGPIVLSDDVLRCGASVYVSCLQLGGASNLTVSHSAITIGFHHDAIHESTFTVSNHSHVSFTDDVITGFGRMGTTRAGSTATVTGGTLAPSGCRGHAVCPAR